MAGLKKNITGLYAAPDCVVAVEAEASSGQWAVKRCGAGTRADGPGFREMAGAALKASGIRGGSVSLSIPDIEASVSVLTFTELPRGSADALRIVKWKAAQEAGLSPELIRLDYQALSRKGDGGVKVLAVAAKKDVIAGYEDAAASVGVEAVRISLHSLSLLNNLREDGRGTDITPVVCVMEGYFAAAFVKGGVLDFYRSRPIVREDDLSKELGASFVYYRGRNPDAAMGRLLVLGEPWAEDAVKKAGFPDAEIFKPGAVLSGGAPLPAGVTGIKVLAALGAAG